MSVWCDFAGKTGGDVCGKEGGGGVVWESMVKVYLRLRQCKKNLTYF